MALDRRQSGVLLAAGLVFLAAAVTLAGLAYFAVLGWFDMTRDAVERGNPALAFAHVLPHFSLLGGLGLFSLFAGALALWSRQWLARPGSVPLRRLMWAAWSCRLTLVLGPVLLVAAWLYGTAVPNPLRQSMLPLNTLVFMALLGLTLLGGPIMVLGWVGLGQWQGWLRRCAEWPLRPGHSGELHRRFAAARLTLATGAAVLLGLFVWLLPEVVMGLSWGGQVLAVQQLIADQRQVVAQLFITELLFGGLMLLAWRGAGAAVCHAADPQATPLSDHLRRTASGERQGVALA